MESAETVSAAAEAQDQKDPDDVASAAVVVTASASKATAATAAQDQDQPDNITAASSVPASAPTVTTAVCCCYITHISSSKNVCLQSYHMRTSLLMFPLLRIFLKNFVVQG